MEYHLLNPISRLEKESKYSSTLLPTRDLPKPRNSSQQLPPLSDFSLDIELEEVLPYNKFTFRCDAICGSTIDCEYLRKLV